MRGRPQVRCRRHPLDDEIVHEATRVLEPLAGAPLTRSEVEESLHNLTAVVELLLRWKAEDDSKASNDPPADARASGRVSTHASKP